MATDFGLQSRSTSGVIIMNVFKSSLSSSLIAAGTVLASLPAQAASDCGSISPAAIRVVEHATGDVGVLRAYIDRTAIIHGLNMIDVRDNLDAWRKTLVCRAEVAAAERAAQTAAAQPDASTSPSACTAPLSRTR